MKPAVLMTDPRHFAIKGGANPHTRTADNRLKVVDVDRAWTQWHAYVDALLDHGVDVYVVDGTPELTGMVFAANAGFLKGRLNDVPTPQKVFYPSHFTAAHRVGEGPMFAAFMQKFGFTVSDYDPSWRFEGEADAFSVGRGEELRWLFTYGFRTDPLVADWLEQTVVRETFTVLHLTDPRYYHGDTLICDLGGPFMVWEGGLDEASRTRLHERFGHRLLELDDDDAAGFVGNSFYVEVDDDRLLFTSSAIRDATKARIEELGIQVIPVDISEFFGKGGGGPKCMVFNLGDVDAEEPHVTSGEREFRHSRHVATLRREGKFHR